ncbi:TPA: putative selenate reductase subunit YgfK, partial [Candidatus Acetothermia bacterium]|nr:putative selenate reductase subunit YgfK [Candidatus Acetothermia bacterium]
MSDVMRVQPFAALLNWAVEELEHRGSIFGIPRSLFHVPRADALYQGELFGHPLATPIGPAAGPHTQLAQNIVAAWLCGGRFIELKTVQIMDELEIPRPCIDMEDEGYNVEWSQELKLDASAGEYVTAWTLIHILHHALGFPGPVGTVFNMSVGYNLEGIRSPRLTAFMDRLGDASAEIADLRETLRRHFPRFADVEIPAQITDNVTLSTMHGCPPDEIERIGRYLLTERGLHTFVKLNPTLLGKEAVLSILRDHLGFSEIAIPDRVFEHDLQYPRAVELIRSLQSAAGERNLAFGVKLSNTLAMTNHKGYLAGEEVYMSGRALYPITMNLFRKLRQEFGDELAVSYAGGADALNVPQILACGARTVTAASDLLKPGGYARLGQWLENLELAMQAEGARDLAQFSRDPTVSLDRAAREALAAERYRKDYFPYGLPKVESGLDFFDCIAAPCVEACPVCQDVPSYACRIARGEHGPALARILGENPFPGVTGQVCPHTCQTRCTRNNYEQPVGIRALKRFAVEQGGSPVTRHPSPITGPKVAIVGSGPSGLSAAYFLALSGVQARVFEKGSEPGGMVRLAPEFRLPRSVRESDIRRILNLGVEIVLDHPISGPPEALLSAGYAAVYVACGFQAGARLGISGEDGSGVWDALLFLEKVATGERPEVGSPVVVIGGGNTAMDAARTAQRLTGRPVTVLYRRTRAEMPAEREEVDDCLAEGNALLELVSPRRIVLRDGRRAAVECVRNRLADPGPDGRRNPVAIPGSEFEVPADTVIVAIGQRPEMGFLAGSRVTVGQDGRIVADAETGATGLARVYAGGDAVRGPATIVEACADGRRAAAAICQELGVPFRSWPSPEVTLSPDELARAKRARARIEPGQRPAVLPIPERGRFDLIEATMGEDAARAEASRCVQCATFCDKCVEVCPNRANLAYDADPVQLYLPVLACREGRLLAVGEETFAVRQGRQIVHVDDLCNECGNCATFCVHQGKPYLDKPRLFLREEGFHGEVDNAFLVRDGTVRRRKSGQELRLSLNAGTMTYEDEDVLVVLSPGFRTIEARLKREFPGRKSLETAA